MNAGTEIIEILDDDEDVVEITEDDVGYISHNDSHTTQMRRVVDQVKFKIVLNPVSLQRHRFTKKGGQVYEPSSSAQSKFQCAVKGMLSSTTFPLYPKIPLWL